MLLYITSIHFNNVDIFVVSKINIKGISMRSKNKLWSYKNICVGALGVGARVVRWLPGALPLPEEQPDGRDEDGHPVPLPVLARRQHPRLHQVHPRVQTVSEAEGPYPVCRQIWCCCWCCNWCSWVQMFLGKIFNTFPFKVWEIHSHLAHLTILHDTFVLH